VLSGSGGPRILAKGMPHQIFAACINNDFVLDNKENNNYEILENK
jgi:hypothetical protein